MGQVQILVSMGSAHPFRDPVSKSTGVLGFASQSESCRSYVLYERRKSSMPRTSGDFFEGVLSD